jgi:hypothetical protein
MIRMSASGEAWPKVTVAAILFMAPLAAMSGRRMRAIRRTCVTATALNSELRGRLQDPVLNVSLGIRIAVMLGIVLLMSAKPEWGESVGIVGASVVLGLLSSVLTSRHNAALSATRAELGD